MCGGVKEDERRAVGCAYHGVTKGEILLFI